MARHSFYRYEQLCTAVPAGGTTKEKVCQVPFHRVQIALTTWRFFYHRSMEQAFTIALQKFFTVKPTGSEKKGSNPRAEFYARYKQEAEHADKDFQNKYEEDLNTTLIFVWSSFVYLLLPDSHLWGYRPVFSQQ